MTAKIQILGAIVLLTAILGSVDAVGFRGFHYKGLKEPKWMGPRLAREKWINQPVDHFNHRNNLTWQMRYYEEDKYFNGSGPILIMLGGEWEIAPGFLQSGAMHNIGSKNGALMFYTEHRYYGISKPTEDTSVENMQYLNVDQALADIAYFIEEKKAEYNIENATVVVFGGSYAGNVAAWARLKYPHLIQGAVASSAPVYAKADFFEYYEVVTRALKRYDPNCVTEVESAFDYAEELLASENGSAKIKDLFNLCDAPNVNSSSDISYFMNYLSEVFASNVQYNSGVGSKSSIGGVCTTMTNRNVSSSIERLANLIGGRSGPCRNLSYSDFIETLQNTEYGDIMRQWFFQTCTEYGYYQTTNSTKSAFGTLFNVDFFIDMCTDIYGEYYKKSLLESGVKRTNIVYGGKLPDVTNVVFVNGDVDPWHALSVLEDLNESSPAILISGSSHCQDLYNDSKDDVPELKAARKRIQKIVTKWLKN